MLKNGQEIDVSGFGLMLNGIFCFQSGCMWTKKFSGSDRVAALLFAEFVSNFGLTSNRISNFRMGYGLTEIIYSCF